MSTPREVATPLPRVRKVLLRDWLRSLPPGDLLGERDSEKTLGGIQCKGGESKLGPERAPHIGCANVAAAVFADVDAADPSDEQPERNGSKQVCWKDQLKE